MKQQMELLHGKIAVGKEIGISIQVSNIVVLHQVYGWQNLKQVKAMQEQIQQTTKAIQVEPVELLKYNQESTVGEIYRYLMFIQNV